MQYLTGDGRENISILQEDTEQNPHQRLKEKTKRDQCNYDIKSQHIQVNE